MKEHRYSGSSVSTLPRRFLFPVALYESNGIIFELYRGARTLAAPEQEYFSDRFVVYDGGQPVKKHEVVWIRLMPITDHSSTASDIPNNRTIR